jgi:hypothetical protein
LKVQQGEIYGLLYYDRPIARFVVICSMLAEAPEASYDYGAKVANRFCPPALPYMLGTDATLSLVDQCIAVWRRVPMLPMSQMYVSALVLDRYKNDQ